MFLAGCLRHQDYGQVLQIPHMTVRAVCTPRCTCSTVLMSSGRFSMAFHVTTALDSVTSLIVTKDSLSLLPLGILHVSEYNSKHHTKYTRDSHHCHTQKVPLYSYIQNCQDAQDLTVCCDEIFMVSSPVTSVSHEPCSTHQSWHSHPVTWSQSLLQPAPHSWAQFSP